MKRVYSHPGEVVCKWRNERGWTVLQLANAVGTSRQSIENLENQSTRNPHFLPALAKVMGYLSSDDLRNLKMPPEGDASGLSNEPEAEDPLEMLDKLLLAVPDQNRKALSQILSEWALHPGQGQWIDAFRALQSVKENAA